MLQGFMVVIDYIVAYLVYLSDLDILFNQLWTIGAGWLEITLGIFRPSLKLKKSNVFFWVWLSGSKPKGFDLESN